MHEYLATYEKVMHDGQHVRQLAAEQTTNQSTTKKQQEASRRSSLYVDEVTFLLVPSERGGVNTQPP